MKTMTCLVMLAALALVGCGFNPTFTADGCIRQKIKLDTGDAAADYCPATNSVRGEVRNEDGRLLRATFSFDTEEWTLTYQADDGSWIEYDSKSGMFDFGPAIEAAGEVKADVEEERDDG
jgi:hypothetical protein